MRFPCEKSYGYVAEHKCVWEVRICVAAVPGIEKSRRFPIRPRAGYRLIRIEFLLLRSLDWCGPGNQKEDGSQAGCQFFVK